MEQNVEYLIKVSLGLAIEYLFYVAFLRRLTFHQWNRVFLVAYAALAFVLPLVNPGSTIKPVKWSVSSVARSVYESAGHGAVHPVTAPVQSAFAERSVTSSSPEMPPLRDLLPWLYLAGVLVYMIRLLAGIVAVERMKRRSEKIVGNGFSLYVSQTSIPPFAFWKSIFLSSSDFSSAHRDNILMHERTHVRQWHSVDTLFAELLVMLCWFNPFAWLLRHAIRQNLEFIVDQKMLDQGVDSQRYQFLLLEVAGYGHPVFGNPFSLSILKERIKMVNRFRSGRVHLAKFLFLIPVISVTLVMCRKGGIENEKNAGSKNLTIVRSGGDRDVFAGMVIDAQSMKPIEKFRMKIIKHKATLEETATYTHVFEKKKEDSLYIETDADGFYYWDDPNVSKGNHYELGSDDPRYNGFIASGGNDVVVFVQPVSGGVHPRFYFLDNGGLPKGEKQHKDFLTTSLKPCTDEFKLITDYKKTRTHSGKLVTHFRNAYFDGEDQLIGYEGKTEFYLDGETTTYDVINSTFEWQAPAIVTPVVYKSVPLINEQRTFSCYTAPVSRDKAPTKNLVTPANVEWVQNLDLSLLNSEPYYLDGFRQMKGIGSNLKPEKGDIKRVAVLKGALARYYNRSLDKVLWIETRPKNEIVGRPEF